MPFFPLAGGEVVAFILLFAIARWIVRSWWRGDLEAGSLRRQRPEPSGPEGGEALPPRPALRLIRGGRYDEPASPAAARHASHRDH